MNSGKQALRRSGFSKNHHRPGLISALSKIRILALVDVGAQVKVAFGESGGGRLRAVGAQTLRKVGEMIRTKPPDPDATNAVP